MEATDLIRALTLDLQNASHLADALETIAGRTRRACDADIGMLFLREGGHDALTLRAVNSAFGITPDELRSDAARDAGVAIQRREPVRTTRGSPASAAAPGAQDGQAARSLIALPIFHLGESVGVLSVARLDSRRFDVTTEDFLATVAAGMAAAISRAMIREDLDTVLVEEHPVGRTYSGAGSSAGIGIGQIVVVGRAELADIPDRPTVDIEVEVNAIRDAVAAAHAELARFRPTSHFQGLDTETRAIFDVYRQLLGEAGLVEEIVRHVRVGNWAAGALRTVIQEKAAAFEQIEDTYMRARAEDFREIGRRILQHLQAPGGAQRDYPEDCILAAEEIGIVEIAHVPGNCLRGLVSRRGSVLSHASVLARALNVPAVMGLADLPLADMDGCPVIVDGHQGKLVVNPAADALAAYRARQQQELQLNERLVALRDQPAETTDGVQIAMFAKAGMLADLGPAKASGVEGIGLYRTEYSFMTRTSFPSEQEQAGGYRSVLEAMAPRPVTMRTLDAGGDKALPYFSFDERNPFLGWRGIRMSLDQPELFLTQLRAMITANRGLGNLRIMFPMIASISELDEALGLLDLARAEVSREEPVEPCPVGVMIEVPAMVYQIEAIARRVDFISIGTNDLVQYLLAVDRDNARVANRYESLHPAVISALDDICARAHRADLPVGVCGEMAGEVEAALLFLGMGVADLSASPARLPFVKALLRRVSRSHARAVLKQALALETGSDVRSLLRQAVSDAGLGELIAAPL